MKNLNLLAQFVAEKNIPTSSLTTTEMGLVKLAESGTCNDDSEAMSRLYANTKTNSTFRALKLRVRERLLDATVNIPLNSEKFSDHFKTNCYLRKRMYAAFLLRSFYLPSIAHPLIKKLLDTATEYHVTDIQFECAKILSKYYSQIGKQRQFEEMNDRVYRIQEVLCAETDAATAQQLIAVRVAKKGDLASNEIREFKDKLNSVNKLRQSIDSHSIHIDYYRSSILLARVEKDHKKIISLCDEALMYLRRRPKLAFNRLHVEFFYSKGIAFLDLRDPINARFAFLSCLRFNTENDNAWFTYQSYAFTLAMHLGEISDAHNALQKVTSSRRLHLQSDEMKERWRLFQAYLQFANIHNADDLHFSERRSIEKILSDFPIFSKSGTGWSFALTLIQALFQLKLCIIDNLEVSYKNLDRYVDKYLNKPETYRSKQFLRMLLLIPKEGGDYNRVEKLGRKYLAKLHSSSQYMDDYEIIPYEMLWSWVLEILTRQQKAGSSSIRRSVNA